ncbi:MAG: hypothetical protein LAN61_02805 [Acidobacteriia bacterium]|nr:hypothetical protein [Terriglobia bacterium]
MKQTLLFFAVIGLASALVSCGPAMALFSLYIREDKIFDEQMLGEWRHAEPTKEEAKSDEPLWIFARGKDGLSYNVTASDTKRKDQGGLVSTARIVKLGNFLFMDFEGPDTEDRDFTFYPYPVVTAHMIARIHADEKTLRIEFLNNPWVKKQVKAGKLALATLDTDDGLLITATTEELRNFALTHAEDAEAFSDRYEFVREKQTAGGIP